MSEKVSAELSRKFVVISCWAMFAVLVVHSKTAGDASASWNVFVQHFLTRAAGKASVPMFFAISGFWFAHSLDGVAIGAFFKREYLRMLVKKARTLFLPYLLWSVVVMVWCLPLICFNNYITHRDLLERTVFDTSSVWGCINNIFGITIHAPVGNAVLWYVRTLLVFFLSAPLWVLLLQASRALFFVAAAVMVIYPKTWLPSPIAFPFDGFGWILMGMCAYVFGWWRKRGTVAAAALLGVGFLAACVIDSAFAAKWIAPCPIRRWIYQWIAILGIPFCWALYDLVPGSGRELPRWTRLTFWVYCIHISFTSYFMAGCAYVFGKSNLVLLLVMCATPFFGLGMSLLAARIVGRFFPRTFAILTGGRGA